MPELKYFFTAFYSNGEFFNQDPADVSISDPSRSSFFDVDHSRLVAFSLADSEHSYVVDLTTGAFILDGVSFHMHEAGEVQGPFTLIFFRRHTHTINAQFVGASHEIVYRIGWQAKDANGVNIQRVMEIQ